MRPCSFLTVRPASRRRISSAVLDVRTAVEARLNAPHNLNHGRLERAGLLRGTGARDTQVHGRELAER